MRGFKTLLIMFLVVVLTGAAAVSISGCNKDTIQDYPYLSDELKSLILADKAGNAAKVAQEEGIRLVDGKVGVMVSSNTSQLEAAKKAIEEHGGSIIWIDEKYGDI